MVGVLLFPVLCEVYMAVSQLHLVHLLLLILADGFLSCLCLLLLCEFDVVVNRHLVQFNVSYLDVLLLVVVDGFAHISRHRQKASLAPSVPN